MAVGWARGCAEQSKPSGFVTRPITQRQGSQLVALISKPTRPPTYCNPYILTVGLRGFARNPMLFENRLEVCGDPVRSSEQVTVGHGKWILGHGKWILLLFSSTTAISRFEWGVFIKLDLTENSVASLCYLGFGCVHLISFAVRSIAD